MARVGDTVDIVDKMLRDMALWYTLGPIPIPFQGLDPRVLAKAKELCDGDWRRCTTDDGESLIVHNRPMW